MQRNSWYPLSFIIIAQCALPEDPPEENPKSVQIENPQAREFPMRCDLQKISTLSAENSPTPPEEDPQNEHQPSKTIHEGRMPHAQP